MRLVTLHRPMGPKCLLMLLLLKLKLKLLLSDLIMQLSNFPLILLKFGRVLIWLHMHRSHLLSIMKKMRIWITLILHWVLSKHTIGVDGHMHTRTTSRSLYSVSKLIRIDLTGAVELASLHHQILTLHCCVCLRDRHSLAHWILPLLLIH